VLLGEALKSEPWPAAERPLVERNVSQQRPKVEPRNPRIPYYENFAKGRPTIPSNTWGPVYSAWNHYSALCVCPNEDVLAAWYTTRSEEGPELAQGAARLRAGSDRWDAASSFLDLPDMNDHAPVLLSDGARLFHFFGQGMRGWDDAAIALRTSDDNGATWTAPKIIWSRDEKVQLSQPCSAVSLGEGKLALAIDGDNHRHERLLVSVDRGVTWKLSDGDFRKSYGDKYAIHPALVGLENGSLLAFLRGPNPLPRFLSSDFGQTWQASETPLPGIGVGQKPAALRLASGAILLAGCDATRKLVGSETYVALSLDNGQTWSHVRKLEGVHGYLSAAQGAYGTIYVFGSKMTVAAFNEAWLKEGPAVKEPAK
jgi:hypothetical protein